MPDREKVIKGLEEISDYFYNILRRCDLVEDAITLLKEHETAPMLAEHVVFGTNRKCSNCGKYLFPACRFCPHCGRVVRWE